MHIYHLGMSSISLPAAATAAAAAAGHQQEPLAVMETDDETADAIDSRPPLQQQQNHHHLQQHDNKRPRELPRLSHSPASVMTGDNVNDNMMMMTASRATDAAASESTTMDQAIIALHTPAVKRQRQQGWFCDATATIGNSTIHHNNPVVSPDQQQNQDQMMLLARNSVTCEREDQYAWWKTPPAAPQLLPSTTMGLASANATAAESSQRMTGCNVCQRLFIPPTITVTSPQIQNNTLLNYFTPSSNSSSSKLRQTPTSGNTKAIDKTACLCTFCERATCGMCLRACEQCHYRFCTLCSTQAYVFLGGTREEEATLCLDCASMLDLKATGIGTNNSTMEE